MRLCIDCLAMTVEMNLPTDEINGEDEKERALMKPDGGVDSPQSY